MVNVSVIITSYNQKNLIVDAVESVLAQSLSAFEIIVCDDASVDGSQDIILGLEKKYPNSVRALLNATNKGISGNRNAGLAAACGEYITWLDGDDIFTPGKLEQEVELIKKNAEAKWAYSQVEENNITESQIKFRYSDPPSGPIFEKFLFMLGRAPRNHMIELAALKEIGFFNPRMQLYEDFELLLRLAHRYPCAYCPEPGMVYMLHGQGVHLSKLQNHYANLYHVETTAVLLLTDSNPQLVPEFRRYLGEFKGKIRGWLYLAAMNQCKMKGTRLLAMWNLCKACLCGSKVIGPRVALKEMVRICLHLS